ncbi:hypothetical protein BWK62_08355 [Flavobacterium oreochromis]|uniref:Uncharacterized protein n=1 Tax=Flavobacterium columnare TaxID=996 RepID=A0A246GAE8_9FLAO|nr:hypothetical protein BWK62_08355 [Flavobacterium oreochromis]
MENKKITSNEENIIKYVNTLSKRINSLKEKKCIDSLIVEVSADCLKNERHNTNVKTYSFPIL